MRTSLLILALSLSGCLDTTPELPTCAQLGCSIAPSGSDYAWEPCPAVENDERGGICYCGSPLLACTW